MTAGSARRGNWQVRVKVIPEAPETAAAVTELVEANAADFDDPERLMAMVGATLSHRHPSVQVRRQDQLAMLDDRSVVYYVFPYGVASPPPFVVVDADRRCVDVSPAATRLLGLDATLLSGRELPARLPADIAVRRAGDSVPAGPGAARLPRPIPRTGDGHSDERADEWLSTTQRAYVRSREFATAR